MDNRRTLNRCSHYNASLLQLVVNWHTLSTTKKQMSGLKPLFPASYQPAAANAELTHVPHSKQERVNFEIIFLVGKYYTIVFFKSHPLHRNKKKKNNNEIKKDVLAEEGFTPSCNNPNS